MNTKEATAYLGIKRTLLIYFRTRLNVKYSYKIHKGNLRCDYTLRELDKIKRHIARKNK
mgnify:CR=1 FL=1